MLFHFVIIAVSVECLLGDKSAESLSSHEPIAGGENIGNIRNIKNFSLSYILLEYSGITEGGLVETDPGYYNNYYSDQAFAQYYQK